MMNVVEQECLSECWGRIRSRGKRDFVVRFGLRRFALETGLALWIIGFVIIPVFFNGADAPNLSYLGSRPFLLSVLAGIVLLPLAGVVWGVAEWHWNEKRYAAVSREAL